MKKKKRESTEQLSSSGHEQGSQRWVADLQEELLKSPSPRFLISSSSASRGSNETSLSFKQDEKLLSHAEDTHYECTHTGNEPITR